MSNLQPNCCLKFDFQKVDQHAGGKWLIHDTKRRKDNQLQSLKLLRDMLLLAMAAIRVNPYQYNHFVVLQLIADNMQNKNL